jgi:hypothetical protein
MSSSDRLNLPIYELVVVFVQNEVTHLHKKRPIQKPKNEAAALLQLR